MIRRVLIFPLILALVLSTLSFTPGMLATAWAAGEVCEINGTPYATLDAALAAVTDGQTITLLAPIDYNQGISITDGRNIIFNLNGFNLNIDDSGGVGLTVTSGSVGYTGAGAFNVSGASFGLNVNGSSASATVTNATAIFPGSYGVNASNGGKITVNNDVEGGYAGAYAFGAASTIVVSGDATGSDANSYGAYAQGGTITIEGNAQGVLCGVSANGSSASATVTNATATAEGGNGAVAINGGDIVVNGNAQGGYNGVSVANTGSTAVVNGNATGTASDSSGARASHGGSVTINGGTAQGVMYGAYSNGSGSSITINGGDAIGTGPYSHGAHAELGGSIHIDGDVQGTQYGVVSGSDGSVVVTGSVTVTAEVNGWGVHAERGGRIEVGGNVVANGSSLGALATYSEITINGAILATNYIKVYDHSTEAFVYKDGSAGSRTIPTTKDGYYTYSAGTSIVWVKEAASADTTPPVWTSGYPFTNYVRGDQLGLAVSADEICTIYYVVLADGAVAPSAEQVQNRQDAGGNTVPGGSFTYSNPPTSVAHYVGGLTPETPYDIYVVLKDSAGNLQAEPARIDVTTLSYFDAIPDDTNSEITDQEQGAAGSKQVTLTVTVRNAAGEAITGRAVGDFSVSIDGAPAVHFVGNPPFSGFANNGDGTYTVVFTGDADATAHSFTNLSVNGTIIEAGPTTVTTPPRSSGGGGISLPSAPLNLRLVSNKDAIHLVWGPVKESIVKGYHVYRSEKGSNHAPVRLTTEPQKDAEYKDRSATIGKTYIYYVVAADIYGRDSLRSNTVEAALATVRSTLDIPSNAWYKDYVEKLLLREVLDGYTDGTFRPDSKITRAEFAKMLCLAMGWEIKNPDKESFPDVAKSSWAYKYIETGATYGVLDGYKEDGMFRPDHFISREEMAKVIAMTLSLPGADSTFKDIDTSWAKEFIKACAKAGIINGYPGDNTFRPKNHTTRAEAAAMIARMLKD